MHLCATPRVSSALTGAGAGIGAEEDRVILIFRILLYYLDLSIQVAFVQYFGMVSWD